MFKFYNCQFSIKGKLIVILLLRPLRLFNDAVLFTIYCKEDIGITLHFVSHKLPIFQ